MQNFDLWYIYYDSLFFSTNPQIPFSLVQRHLPSQNNQNAVKVQWPKIQPIELSASFHKLEQFIKNKQNWLNSSCTSQELQNIQDNLNYLLLLLQLQKQYANEFWKTDKRRIQSSATHIYIFIQIFVKSIIPYTTMTIFESKAANKLCVNINNLQNLANSIRKSLNQIFIFFQGEMFREEANLTKNFFQHWVELLKRLPNIKKQKFDHLPQLTRYINLTNKIEVWEKNYKNKNNKKNKKIQIKKPKSNEDSKSDTQSEVGKNHDTKTFCGTIYSIRKLSTSCETRNYQPQNQEIWEKPKFQKIFYFPEEIENYEETEKKQIQKGSTSYSIENSPVEQRKLKKKSETVGNFNNDKSVSKTRKNTPSAKKKRIKTITDNGIRSRHKNSLTISNDIKSSKAQESEMQEERSHVKYKKLQKKQKSQKKEKEEERPEQQEKQEKDYFLQALPVKQKKMVEMREEARIFYERDKKFDDEVQVETGRKVSRGWQLIRDYVNKGIAERKLKRLLGV